MADWQRPIGSVGCEPFRLLELTVAIERRRNWLAYEKLAAFVKADDLRPGRHAGLLPIEFTRSVAIPSR